MGAIKVTVAKVKNNWIGALAGAVIVTASVYKFGKVRNKWALVGSAIAGAAGGVMIQSAVRSKQAIKQAAKETANPPKK